MEHEVVEDNIGSLCKDTEKQAIQAAKWVAKEIRAVTREVYEIYRELQEIHTENQKFLEKYRGGKQELKTGEYNR